MCPQKLFRASCSSLLILLVVACATTWSVTPSIVGKAEEAIQPNGLVILLTDFGSRDFYVGAMKGAIYSVFPDAHIDSISHEIPPFDISEGSYILAKAAVEFPPGTVFVIVVDPGVGTPRKPIVMRTEDDKLFVAPDNGVLTHVADALGVIEVREISNTSLMRGGALSSTFHGRDIFGPTGAHLASGTPFSEVGPVLEEYIRIARRPAERKGDTILGQVELVDEYGNALTNIPRRLFSEVGIEVGQTLQIRIGDTPRQMMFQLVNTYADVPIGEPLALFGSGDVLEFAINQGHLGERLRIRTGDRVEVRFRLSTE